MMHIHRSKTQAYKKKMLSLHRYMAALPAPQKAKTCSGGLDDLCHHFASDERFGCQAVS
jgi:hypothetical protein